MLFLHADLRRSSGNPPPFLPDIPPPATIMINNLAPITTSPETSLFQQLQCLRNRIRMLSQTPGADHETIESLEKASERTTASLVQAHWGLVQGLAGRLSRTNHRLGHADDLVDDLAQEGMIGLTKAVAGFDWRRGNRFSTYAYPMIRWAMIGALASQFRNVRIPEGQLPDLKKVMNGVEQLKDLGFSNPLSTEVAEVTGLPEKRVRMLLGICTGTISLDAPAGDADGMALGELIADSGAQDPAAGADMSWRRKLVRQALGMLGERERMMFEMRHGLHGDLPLAFVEIGRRFGVSGQRASQIISGLEAKISRFASACEYHGWQKAAEIAGLVKPVAAPRESARRKRREGLQMRQSPNRDNHHIWNNHGTWYCNLTFVTENGKPIRIRKSLRTKDVGLARLRRDEAIRQFPGYELAR